MPADDAPAEKKPGRRTVWRERAEGAADGCDGCGCDLLLVVRLSTLLATARRIERCR